MPQLVHGVHHGAVRRFLVGLDDDDLVRLVFKNLLDPRFQLTQGHRLSVQVDVLVPVNRHDRLVLGFRLFAAVRRKRQRHWDALLQQRSDDHHDDEQHQHDVDEGRDVDVGLDAATAAEIHCHGSNSS